MTRTDDATRNDLLSLDDVLAAAMTHEHLAINRYRWVSLRFLPFSVALSRLFEALAGEAELRLQNLTETAERLGKLEQLPAAAPPISDGQRRHFFVTDEEAAAEIMACMLAEEHAAQRFYSELRTLCALPTLDGVLGEAIEQTRLQARLLEESGTQLLQGRHAGHTEPLRCAASGYR
ncbi:MULTISPECIES: hypothetical protein [unclassified Modicisalibacter]|uniref:hypothetical protein n=1 Tax=unclassified Modicisalibacter TaxID=2679913 RepID=UPI001CCAC2C8|nr:MULTISPECIES: hypothetical protein [unclassified Modicisalibacter]MBZ9559858.1 hypothetical protein [Modicisalibacter sp. R2A 31.J]MBZ9577310.1 hypothetical protein [Modicisalibacter sp. MOD 31.J]